MVEDITNMRKRCLIGFRQAWEDGLVGTWFSGRQIDIFGGMLIPRGFDGVHDLVGWQRHLETDWTTENDAEPCHLDIYCVSFEVFVYTGASTVYRSS